MKRLHRLKLASLVIVLLLVAAACSASGGQEGTSVPDTGPSAQADTPLASSPTTADSCEPTVPDMLGPFYEPGAPEREAVGEGYILRGSVQAAGDCQSVPGAQIEFWMAGPDGEYRDEYRAILFSDENGSYQFSSHFPPPYSGRPSHIHIRVTADGYQELVTQHYPQENSTDAVFNLVIQKAE